MGPSSKAEAPSRALARPTENAPSGSGPAVLFLHDVSANRRSWEGVVRRIEGRLTVLVPDVPGHGDSEAPAAGGHRIAVYALSRFRKPIARYILERRMPSHRVPALVLAGARDRRTGMRETARLARSGRRTWWRPEWATQPRRNDRAWCPMRLMK